MADDNIHLGILTFTRITAFSFLQAKVSKWPKLGTFTLYIIILTIKIALSILLSVKRDSCPSYPKSNQLTKLNILDIHGCSAKLVVSTNCQTSAQRGTLMSDDRGFILSV